MQIEKLAGDLDQTVRWFNSNKMPIQVVCHHQACFLCHFVLCVIKDDPILFSLQTLNTDAQTFCSITHRFAILSGTELGIFSLLFGVRLFKQETF